MLTARRGSRSRWPRLTSVVAAGLVAFGLVVPVSKVAADPAPTTGPTQGGTSVSDTVRGVTFTQVSAGAYGSMTPGAGSYSEALGSDGNIYVWGNNDNGRLGIGSTTTASVPTPTKLAAPAGVSFKQVSAGGYHSLALTTDGQVYAWGTNGSGQLGNNSTTNSPAPVKVQIPAGVTIAQVSAGNDVHSLALASNGTLYAWGANYSGQLGNGTATNSLVPVVVNAPATGVTFTQVAANSDFSVGLGSDSKVYAWGTNWSNQLGDGTTTTRNVPTPVQGLPAAAIKKVAADQWSGFAIAADGSLWGWGTNNNGQLGVGDMNNRTTAVKTQAPSGVTFSDVSASSATTVAIGSDGKSYAWGNNQYGQFGNGPSTVGNNKASALPLPVTMPAGVTFSQLSAGANLTLAVGSDGNTYAWGRNASGEIGDGTTTLRNVPTLVATTPTVTAVSFGGVPATNLSQSGSTWTATTPAQCGTQDVTVSYTQFGVAQTSVTKNGFTFGTAPVVTTQPSAVSVDAGKSATLSATASGDATPTVQWQQAASATGPWTDIAGATDAQLSLSPTQNVFVQAVFTNCNGTSTTDAVAVTVNAAPSQSPSASPSTSTSASSAPASPSASASSNPTASGAEVSPAPSESPSSVPGGQSVATSGSASGPAAGVAAVVLIAALAAAVAAGYQAKRRIRR